MNPLPVAGRYLGMILSQNLGSQKLQRSPDQRHAEPAEAPDSTKMVIAHAVALELLHRVLPDPFGGTMMDFARGPENFTRAAARYLRCTGSERRADFSCFVQGAHRLPRLDDVTRVLREMDRVTRADGVIFVSDHGRLRTAELTERYVRAVGTPVCEHFRNSQYDAWTPDELRRSIPEDGDRVWFHLTPSGLPTLQFIVGLPVGREELFLRRGLPWEPEENPVPAAMRLEWRMLRASLLLGSRSRIRPAPGKHHKSTKPEESLSELEIRR